MQLFLILLEVYYVPNIQGLLNKMDLSIVLLQFLEGYLLLVFLQVNRYLKNLHQNLRLVQQILVFKLPDWYLTSKSYSCKAKIHLTSLPLGCLKLYRFCNGLWFVTTKKVYAKNRGSIMHNSSNYCKSFFFDYWVVGFCWR